MPIQWDADGDFSAIVDTLDSIVIHRTRDATTPTIVNAWKVATESFGSSVASESLMVSDTTWQIPVSANDAPLIVGDVIVDLAGNRGTIRSIHQMRGRTRTAYVARSLRLTSRDGERFDLETPAFIDHVHGQAFAGWRLTRAGRVGILLPPPAPPSGGVPTQTLVFIDPQNVKIGDRVRGVRSGCFSIVGIEPSESAGDPQVLRVRRESVSTS